MTRVFRVSAHPYQIGRARNGMLLIPVAHATCVRVDSGSGDSWSRWDIDLKCGHVLRNHLRNGGASNEPRWAACRKCTEAAHAMPKRELLEEPRRDRCKYHSGEECSRCGGSGLVYDGIEACAQLHALLRQSGLTLRELAERSGRSLGTVNKLIGHPSGRGSRRMSFRVYWELRGAIEHAIGRSEG